jgi:DNA-binding beta-propeller fold protein YncE
MFSGLAGTVLALASDGTSSKLEVWMADPASGELVPGAATTIRIGGTARKATILAISGDGSYVGAAASESSWIWLTQVALDGSLGGPVELVGGSGGLSGMGYVRGLAFSPDADRLYALSNTDRSVYVFQRTGAAWSLLQRFALDDQPCGTLSVLRSLAINHDGSRLAVAAASSDVVVILDVGPGGLVWRSEVRRTAGFPDIDYPQALAFSPSGRLATGCKDSGALVILDVDAVPPVTIAVRKAPDGLPGVPAALSWSADGRFIGLSTFGAAAILHLDAEGQFKGSSVFDAADAAGLASPAGLAMVGSSLYLACPDTQALVILGLLPE